MIELYVVVTLAAMGYMMNKAASAGPKTLQKDAYTLQKGQAPSCTNVYNSTHYVSTNNILQQRADAMYKRAIDPVATNVISRDFALEKEEHMRKKFKSLTGEYVAEDKLAHNNMVPFFGGRMKQNMNDSANNALLETYTGVTPAKSKCEVKSLFDMKENVGNVNGMKNNDDFYRDRYAAPRLRNNETPVEKVYVGPGLNQGFTSKPTGGYQQLDAVDYAMPKCVDQLRAANKPKTTFEGRIVDGMKSSLPGKVGAVEKNRVETFYEQTEDNLFKTTGAYLKPSEVPEFNVKPTHRLTTSKQYIGTAVSAQAKARTAEGVVQMTHRSQYGEFGVRNPALNKLGKGERDDYGKAQIMVYANERDVTSTRVHQGNLTSLIKALIAPFEDMVKVTKKDDMVNNARTYGNMNVQVPEKAVVHDPNDVARTTIKETTIHDAIISNLRGHEKITVHDPNDVAKTTVKETTIHDSVIGNLKGNEKVTVYDPNDIARTTIKETLIHDEIDTGTMTGPKQLYVYDPDEVAKKTMRETLERLDYEMNLAGGARKGKVYDPEDIARRTMKETLDDAVREGNLNRVEGMGDYKTTEFDPRRTQKEFLSDNDYYGAAARTDADGYKTNPHEAKNTQKQFLSDIEYYGNSGAIQDKKQKSYDDMMNARITPAKEVTLVGRAPTQVGPKSYVTGESIAMSHKKMECDVYEGRETPNMSKTVTTETPNLSDDTFTRMRQQYKQDDRLDVSLLKAFLENPYTQPLDSVA
jgi:hypothetical protein